MEYVEFTLTSKHHHREFKADARYVEDSKAKPVIIFNHGFKGFKDWGPFNIVAEKFARAGFVFVKMNFSHNGVTLEQPNEFADLEAFAKNNFCIELDDTGVLIDYLFAGNAVLPSQEIDLNRLYILGHSRGGASAILKAYEDIRIKGVVTWAAINNLEAWHSKGELEYWQKNGRIYIHNSRTNQQMPIDYQLVENFIANRQRLQVPFAVKMLHVPMLSIHGSGDTTVPVTAVKEIKSWNPKVDIKIIEGANHTFGGGHPYAGKELPGDLGIVIDHTINFYKSLE